MTNYTVTSKLKEIKHALVDFVSDGYIERDGEKIPCEIGYTNFSGETEATHIFIKSGITENGTHYCSETIEF